MKIELLEAPLHFRLHGIEGEIKNEHCSAVGMRLMDEMWRVVKSAGIATLGVNHWV